MSRREFLEATAAAAITAGAAGAADAPASQPGQTATRIRVCYLAKPVPSWPKPGLDVPGEVARLQAEMAKLADRMPGVQLEGHDLFRVIGHVPSSAEALRSADGVLAFNLTSGVGDMLARLAGLGRPTILYSQPYSGHDWSAVAGLRKAGRRIIVLSTSDYAEIAAGCRLIDTIRRLRDTRILCVTNAAPGAKRLAAIRERVGPTVVWVDPQRVNAAYQQVDESAAAGEAREWIKAALRVIEPSEQDIVNSCRLYLALRQLMKEEGAQAVTIDCLGLFARKQLPAYPCLSHCRMNDLGLVGVCEADLDSTLTQLMFTYAFGVPGFVSDPVIDTATNTVIHAHCVSATRMDGPGGERAPFLIRSHMEDNKGASLQVRMRIGQVITCAKLVNLDTMLISTGRITDVPDGDRGCRTKITTKVADARKMLNEYAGGLHRVIFYGDRVAWIKDLGRLMGFNEVEEC